MRLIDSDKGKEIQKKYNETDKGKARQEKYNKIQKGIEARRRYEERRKEGGQVCIVFNSFSETLEGNKIVVTALKMAISALDQKLKWGD